MTTVTADQKCGVDIDVGSLPVYPAPQGYTLKRRFRYIPNVTNNFSDWSVVSGAALGSMTINNTVGIQSNGNTAFAICNGIDIGPDQRIQLNSYASSDTTNGIAVRANEDGESYLMIGQHEGWSLCYCSAENMQSNVPGGWAIYEDEGAGSGVSGLSDTAISCKTAGFDADGGLFINLEMISSHIRKSAWGTDSGAGNGDGSHRPLHDYNLLPNDYKISGCYKSDSTRTCSWDFLRPPGLTAVSATTLAAVQGINSNIVLSFTGRTFDIPLNLTGATSFANAASLMQTAFNNAGLPCLVQFYAPGECLIQVDSDYYGSDWIWKSAPTGGAAAALKWRAEDQVGYYPQRILPLYDSRITSGVPGILCDSSYSILEIIISEFELQAVTPTALLAHSHQGNLCL